MACPMTNIQPEVGLERLVDLSTISNSSTACLVLPLEMVDNSIYPCELISGWFSPHSTLQVGNFVL